MSPTASTHIEGVLPIAPTSTWATRIAGKRKNRASVDNKACDTTKRRKYGMKVRLNTHNRENNGLSTNWMRTTLNGQRWQLQTWEAKGLILGNRIGLDEMETVSVHRSMLFASGTKQIGKYKTNHSFFFEMLDACHVHVCRNSIVSQFNFMHVCVSCSHVALLFPCL
jgi:hypothetical protein